MPKTSWNLESRERNRALSERGWGITARLAPQFLHGFIKTAKGKLEHAVAADNFTDELDGASVIPGVGLNRVEPDEAGIGFHKALEPQAASLFIPVLNRAARIGYLIGRHGRIAYNDDFVFRAILVENVPCGNALIITAAIVFPEALIGAVVEVVVFHVLISERAAENNSSQMRI